MVRAGEFQQSARVNAEAAAAEATAHVPLLLIGCKADLRHDDTRVNTHTRPRAGAPRPLVPRSEAEAVAAEAGLQYFEVSAKDNTGLNRAVSGARPTHFLDLG